MVIIHWNSELTFLDLLFLLFIWCYACIYQFCIREELTAHLRRIKIVAYMYLNKCFKCKVCTNKSNSLGALKNHIYCNHALKSEIFSKASFSISNDFVCGFCISSFRFVEKMKNLIYCIHAYKLPQPNQQHKTTQNNFCWCGIIIGWNKPPPHHHRDSSELEQF